MQGALSAGCAVARATLKERRSQWVSPLESCSVAENGQARSARDPEQEQPGQD